MNLIILMVVFVIICMIFKRYVLEKFSIGNLRSRNVFITGCDSGFGHMLALKLAENGVPVFAGCLTEGGKIELEKKSQWMPAKLWPISLDVTDDESVAKAAEFVKSELKDQNLWGVVCNAGIASVGGPDDWLNVEDYKKTMDVNTLGVIRTCHAFKPLIKKSKGRIVIMTSMLGRTALPHIGPYCVSKFAAEGYADIIRLEGRDYGFSVHILEPGFFPTNINEDFMQKLVERSWSRLDEPMKKEYGEKYVTQTKNAISYSLSMFWARDNNVNDVVDAYYHALTSKFPRLRYHIGRDSIFLLIPMATFYTTSFQDLLHVLIDRVRGWPIPAVCKRK